MTVQPSYNVIPVLAPLGSKRRPGQTISKVEFIVAHDTGNPGASARGHANWYRSDPNPKWVSSAHLFVDDTEIIETVPALTAPAERAYHVLFSVLTDNKMFGADANSSAIGVEYCYGGNIDADQAYDRYVWVLAKLCKEFGLDPANRIVGHEVLDPTRKIDPSNGLSKSGRSYAKLLTDVVARFATLGGEAGKVGSVAIKPGKARATVHLNRREDHKVGAKKVGQLKPGDTITVASMVTGDRVMGIDQWCIIGEKDYCWSGGLVQA